MRQSDPRFVLTGLCATALVCWGCRNADSVAAPAASSDNGDGVVVKTVVATRADLTRTTTQPATVHAYFEARVHAKVSGYLTELRVDIGKTVEAGDVLAIIDVPEMVKQRERQDLVIRRLESEEHRAAVEVDLARANVAAADADVKKANAQIAADQAEFNRVEELVRSGSVEGQLLDEVRAELDAAQAELASAEANVDVFMARVAAAQADQAIALAETEVARKQLEELDEMMRYATLTAPFAGVVVQRGVEVGDLVRNTQTTSDSQEPLFTVAQIDRVRIRIAVPENDAPWADAGDPVAVQLTALTGRPINGEITRVARSLDESTRTMLVEVDVSNPDFRLIPGLYGEATISLGAEPGALVLPASAVRYTEAGESSVYVVDDAGVVQEADVETGLDDGNQIQITSGLSEGARVVDAMIGRLEPGLRVQVE